MLLIANAIIVAILVAWVWYLLSPIFPKIGGFVGKKAKNFKKKWEEKEIE